VTQLQCDQPFTLTHAQVVSEPGGARHPGHRNDIHPRPDRQRHLAQATGHARGWSTSNPLCLPCQSSSRCSGARVPVNDPQCCIVRHFIELVLPNPDRRLYRALADSFHRVKSTSLMDSTTSWTSPARHSDHKVRPRARHSEHRGSERPISRGQLAYPRVNWLRQEGAGLKIMTAMRRRDRSDDSETKCQDRIRGKSLSDRRFADVAGSPPTPFSAGSAAVDHKVPRGHSRFGLPVYLTASHIYCRSNTLDRLLSSPSATAPAVMPMVYHTLTQCLSGGLATQSISPDPSPFRRLLVPSAPSCSTPGHLRLLHTLLKRRGRGVACDCSVATLRS